MGKIGISRNVYKCEKHGEHEHFFALADEGYATNNFCLHCFNKFITQSIGTMTFVRTETVEQEVDFNSEEKP